MQGGSSANSGYHAENSDVVQTEDQMVEATIGALANLATATATDHSNELKDIKAILKKERGYRKGQRTFNPLPMSLNPARKIPLIRRVVIPMMGHAESLRVPARTQNLLPRSLSQDDF
jgi:hypothetical protein